MQQAAFLDGLSLDLLSSSEDGVRPAEVDICRRQVSEAFVIAVLVVVVDEVADRLLQRPGEVVVLKQDAVLQGLVPALDLSLSLRIVWRPSDMTRDGLGLRSSSASGPPDRYRSYQR